MSTALFDLTGRVALVTGSSQGIGLALAEGMARAGARIVVNGRDPAKLQKTVESLKEKGISAALACFDVSDPSAAKAGVAEAERSVGPIDILVNNAGIQRRAPFVDFPPDDYHAICRTNIDGVFFVTQAVARGMVERKRGKIINICSVLSDLGRPTIVPYATSKGAVKMMTKGLCAELGRHNIQVNGIGPGYIETELNTALLNDKAFSSWVETRTPAGRWGKVEELVGAAIFLASPASNYVNGQILFVDGGMTAAV